MLAAVCAAATVVFPEPAYAIPSPELVVGTLSSLSQVAALLSAVLGGGAVAANARSKSGHGRSIAPRLALACGAAMLASLVLNAIQYDTANNDQARRLEATLQRPAPKNADGSALDPNLKELPFSEQQGHPLALDTKSAAAIAAKIAAGTAPSWQIIDIRETAETESGTLPNARKIRFPDLPQSNAGLESKTTLFICHNGNRSAETCLKLAAQGFDCRFIAGGLEKWLTEGLPLDGLAARSVDELRKIPGYPNHQTLLDTPDVEKLVAEGRAIFVDVRYPGEFEYGHIAGAINLPLRPTPTAEITKRFRDLPKRPIIAPCYDRRSCFFGEILGLELTRAGHDFRGRYSVPWEYFVAGKRPPHVEAFLAEANMTSWQRISRAVTNALERLTAQTGLPLALCVLALISRLIIMPFALKSDRDQLVARALAPEIADMKQCLSNDPQRLSRSMKALFKKHNLTPGRNLIALLFLPVLATLVTAASTVAERHPAPFLWFDTLAAPDLTLTLPMIFGWLTGVYLHFATATTGRQRALCWIVVTPLLVAAAALLPAAADVYMIASAVLLLVQRAIVVTSWDDLARPFRARRRWRMRRTLKHDGIVPLSEPARLTTAGNKALRLGLIQNLNLPVPHGIVLTATFLEDYEQHDAKWRASYLKRIGRAMGSKPMAVRSSGAAEDGANQSFAGAFESVLNVSREGLEAAINTVLASFASAKAAGYAHGMTDCSMAARNIVIQHMVPAEISGVLFTEDPEAPGLMLIEAVNGTADKLVSGFAAPSTYRFGRLTGKHHVCETPTHEFTQLIALAKRIEAHFGQPQDIEWAYANGQFLILQSRDITAGLGTDETQRHFNEWQRLACLAHNASVDALVFEQDEMAEMLPRPTPLSLSLLEAMWASGGSVDLAARTLGLETGEGTQGRSYYVNVFGRLYKDKREEAARAPRLSKLAIRRICRMADDIELDFRSVTAPGVRAHARIMDSTDFFKLTTAELSHTLECEFTRFITETHAETGTINICAGLFMTLARREIERADGDPAAILAGTPPSELHHALRVALTLVERDTVPFLKREIGHRTALDYELSEPRAGESNDTLGRTAVAFYQALPRQLSDAIAAPPNLEKPSRRKKMDMIALARRFQTLKDDAKHVSLREIATLRRLALEMGKRFGLGERVFFLTMPELLSLDASNAAALQVLADGRQQIHDAFKSAPPLASSLTAGDIELGPLAARVTGTTNGTRVSGTGGAVGRAIFVNHAVAETGKPIQGFRDGDIIVAPLIHPAWLPEVIRAGGVVTTIGGWLSHMSIVAREHGVTMIIGVTGLAQIETGTMLRLNANGTIEITGQPNTGVCPWPPGRNNFQPKSVLTATTTGRAASTAMAAEFPQFDRTKTNGFGLNSLNGNALQSG